MSAVESLKAHIARPAFPCVAAKSVLSHDNMEIYGAGDMRCPAHDGAIHKRFREFSKTLSEDTGQFRSFIVLYDGPLYLKEREFELALWDRLSALAAIDEQLKIGWDEHVSNDPDSPTFGMSIGGEAYYVIGMHPQASRLARRLPQPAMVFNSHRQFRQLRKEGKFERFQQVINRRDLALSGSKNPMLVDHGVASEARQYSGRMVEENWQCPFKKQ